jgi:hypothetical protein
MGGHGYISRPTSKKLESRPKKVDSMDLMQKCLSELQILNIDKYENHIFWCFTFSIQVLSVNYLQMKAVIVDSAA